MAPHKAWTLKRNTIWTFISVNMLVWWQSILVPLMLWLQLKWWINRYVNDYYAALKHFTLWKLGPINHMMRKIYMWIVRRVWTKRWKTQTLVVETWRVDGWILCEWSCVDEDDVILMPWFQAVLILRGRGQGAQTNECVQEVRIAPFLF